MRKFAVTEFIMWTLLMLVVGLGIYAQDVHDRNAHANPCTLDHTNCYSVQGESTDHHCRGEHVAHHTPLYIYAEDGTPFFLECVAEAAPPPSDLPSQLLELITRFRPRSTSEWHRFDTLDAAALYAAGRLEKCSHYYECSGLIVVDPKGKFTVGPVRTDYNSDSVSVSASGVPSDWVKAAAVHSHPCVPNHYTYLFSPQDVMGAIGERIINFMVDVCSGAVHKFDPMIDRPDVTQADGIWMTGGRVVGYVTAYPNGVRADEGI